jgi:hypothetical protein
MVREELPSGTALVDLGEVRLKDLLRAERVFQLVASEVPSEFPPIKTLDRYRNNLPPQPTALIGREKDLSEVRERLLSPEVRLLTLTGLGAGKTRVGLQAAADLLEEFEDGVFFVTLATLTDPTLVAPTLTQTLGVAESREKHPEDALREFLRDRELLLLMDNFEQVLEATLLLEELLAAAPRLKILATSRAALRLYGEHEFPVPSLELPDPAYPPPPERLTQYEAVRLFVERARSVKPDIRRDQRERPCCCRDLRQTRRAAPGLRASRRPHQAPATPGHACQAGQSSETTDRRSTQPPREAAHPQRSYRVELRAPDP